MAKDRFSNQKPINYSKEFKYGISAFSEMKRIKKPLDENRKAYIRLLLSHNLTDWELDFVNNILKKSEELSEKQKSIILKIARKFY